jgi:hypothetical protein
MTAMSSSRISVRGRPSNPKTTPWQAFQPKKTHFDSLLQSLAAQNITAIMLPGYDREQGNLTGFQTKSV